MTRVGAFLVRRIVASIFTLLAMILATFAIYWAIGSSPASFLYPFAQHLYPYQIHRANHVFGVDRPKVTQYADYVWRLAHGDFGTQWNGAHVDGYQHVAKVPIGSYLFADTRITASLLLGGAVLVLLIALPLGALTARYRNSIGDRIVSLLTLAAICTHPMVVGLILRTIFGDRLRWLPESGYCTFIHHPAAGPVAGSFFGAPAGCAGGPWPWFEHLILPWFSFALLFLALYTRMSRASVLEVMHEDFVRTARAKGASESRVVGIHVLPNAGIRILTMIGMEIGTAIGIAIYIEAAYGLGGLASLAVREFSGSALDLPVILAIVTMITLVVIVGNLIVDLVYVFVDPRVGGGTMRARRTSDVAEPVVV
jgi:peptide/nickel transport system permease protein